MHVLRLSIAFAVALALQLAPQLTSGLWRINSQSRPKTVQISLDVDADVLIEDSTHQRIGVDLKTRKFVNEIPDARTIEREGSLTFVLPFDKAGKPYMVKLTGNAHTPALANLSMTGPGFVVGARKLNLRPGDVEVVGVSSNGTAVSLVQSRDGPAPQLFLTSQSDRTQPSYRFEVAAASLSRGKTMTVGLDLAAGHLNFKSTEITKSSFSVNLRRTNPGGSRDTYSHADVSFSRDNNYRVDFGKWDGKSDVCFYEVMVRQPPCTALKNEAPANRPN
jgi:hypothetical protein